MGRRIARVSATPGKTRALTVYELPPRRRGYPGYYLLDLPGYGYANAGKSERVGFRRLIAQALERPRLAGVLWLLDIRHAPSADDRAMQELLAKKATGVLAALTKSDTLARGRWLERERALADALALDHDQLVVTSARAGEGIGELREAIVELMRAIG